MLLGMGVPGDVAPALPTVVVVLPGKWWDDLHSFLALIIVFFPGLCLNGGGRLEWLSKYKQECQPHLLSGRWGGPVVWWFLTPAL